MKPDLRRIMSSVVDPHPDPSPTDELVAYLDGELPPTDCRRVESRLATDEDYRQQLHDLDRAWEALDALPASAVDDGFARTTIELACVAAQADLSQHSASAIAASRNRSWRWMAAGVAAIVVGFLIGRALLPDDNKALVADLPAIHQVNVLPEVDDVSFLRSLSKLVPADQLVKDEPAFERNVTELKRANSSSFEDRRTWIQSLAPEQKAELADRARAFEDSSEEQSGMRKVMADIRQAQDASDLQRTLVAYGQWFLRHTPGEKQQLREELSGKTSDEQANLIAERVRREDEQALHHLSDADAEKLRNEIFKLVEQHKSETDKIPQARERGGIAGAEAFRARQTGRTLQRLLRNDRENDRDREQTERQLIGQLSPAAQSHWDKIGRFPRERNLQIWQWIVDALRPKWGPKELEEFFVSDKLSDDKRAQLLNLRTPEMQAALKQRFINSELGVDVMKGQFPREFAEPGRMQRNGPPGGQLGPERQFGPGPGRQPRPTIDPISAGRRIRSGARRPTGRRPSQNKKPSDASFLDAQGGWGRAPASPQYSN